MLALIKSINKNNDFEDKVEFNYFMYKANILWREVHQYADSLIDNLEESKGHDYNRLSLDFKI